MLMVEGPAGYSYKRFAVEVCEILRPTYLVHLDTPVYPPHEKVTRKETNCPAQQRDPCPHQGRVTNVKHGARQASKADPRRPEEQGI